MTGDTSAVVSTMDLFSQRFNDFVNNPITNWSRLISPTINFGCNIEDAPCEEAVLNGVGSYGKQINKLNDAVTVLLSHINRHSLNSVELDAVREFEALAARADECSAKAQGKAQSPLYSVTRAEIEQMIEKYIQKHPAHHKS